MGQFVKAYPKTGKGGAPQREYDDQVEERKDPAESEVPAIDDIALQPDQIGVAIFVQRGAHGYEGTKSE